MNRIFALCCLFFLSNLRFSVAQPSVPSPKYEFRGTWVATVGNLDFPLLQLSSAIEQQTELRRMFDQLKAIGINAIFFQVRSECDALYPSSLEPWSVSLTGEQGKAPEPFWDPLQFAIEEAHKRGMELHAWINPFRAIRPTSNPYRKAANHVSVTHPEWMLRVGTVTHLDPGIPEVQDYITEVAMDIVKRYDIDGLHYDDYFYPYEDITKNNEDRATYEKYGKPQGFSDIKAWRIQNINNFVKKLSENVLAQKPGLKVGVSPFGIYQNGVPAGIKGLDAINVIFADSPTWLKEKWIDYLVPQLYWTFGGETDYGKLALWWASIMNGRHLYIGHGLYRADANTSPIVFSPSEIPKQVRFNRTNNIQGSVFYRALNLSRYASGGFADSLRQFYYKTPALTPPLAWKDQRLPRIPQELIASIRNREVHLSWKKNDSADTGEYATVRRYAIYRVEAENLTSVTSLVKEGQNLLAVTGETSFIDKPPKSNQNYFYAITALSPNSIESVAAENIVKVQGSLVATEAIPQPSSFHLEQNYPNPFTESTEIRFSLSKASYVSLKIYNQLGQEVRTLLNQNQIESGVNTQTWDGRNDAGQVVGKGIYLCTLQVGDRRTSMTLVKM